ncbi:hypothetical protein [Pseudonocardia asaccharolytica]|uniref:Uncharacterized protein n=1 Tax=Pseudonocardia asaccharolytica DSM 44247 = NBRC 16224 TaxID=1123024 RepID=A0A511D3J2_9PSEU|nr:hypothetical protein [Pseudonocardia asaccharolytica]GEL19335.1 hypothetical protein PA7_31720 [Pseudonocardia asaccharolytica DSM 44247 = NBRC 16224]
MTDTTTHRDGAEALLAVLLVTAPLAAGLTAYLLVGWWAGVAALTATGVAAGWVCHRHTPAGGGDR